MQHLNPLRIATVGLALAVAATAAPFASSAADRLLTDKDLKKVSGKVSDWYEAIAEGKGKMDAEADIREELAKLNDKNRKLKGTTLLASPEDLGAMIYLSNKYDRKQPKRGAGKVMDRTVDNGARGTVEYAIWSPSKYKAKSGPYPLIISLPQEGENPKTHITNHWVDGGLRETFHVPVHKLHPVDLEKMPGGKPSVALVETLCIGCHAVNRAAVQEGEWVLIVGAGPVGMATG